jgi:hypothetical protein
MIGQLSLFEDNDPPQWVPGERRIVYFIVCDQFIKIGFTRRSVEERLSEHATGNPRPMQILGSIVVGDHEDDRDLHRRFARFHAHGEWFHNVEVLRVAISKTINGQRTTAPVRIAKPTARNQPCGFPLDCPECKTFMLIWLQITDGPLAADVFGRVICPRCGIRVPFRWEENALSR